MSVEPGRHFAIRGPDAAGVVDFWMAKRLSFDNKKPWEKELVSQLTERLAELQSPPDA